jgi:YD repeat-containing protein
MTGRNRIAVVLAGAATALAASAAIAAETIVYRYDARGRLVKVERSGTVNPNVVTQYTYDKADNRTVKTTTGSPNPPPP